MKTSLLLETIALNQKEDPNFIAGWLESEGSLELSYLEDTFGIDMDRFFYVEHDKEGGAEGALGIIEAVIESGSVDMMVVNSLKCLVPKDELKKDLGDAIVGMQARMNARMTRKFTSIVSENEVAFVLITHLSTQIGSMSRDQLGLLAS